MRSATTFLLLFAMLIGCSPSNDQITIWKNEIAAAEKSFCDMAQQEGMAKAFEFYAAPDGAIKRGNNVIKGKEAIRAWYENDAKPGDSLTWAPTYIDVSASGDMGYTYGDYRFTYLDSLGNRKESTGIFHTVWKKQPDGSWRFVWD